MRVDCGNGVTVLYAHCSKILVTKGQSVSTGQAIALISVVQTFVPFDVDVQGDFENNVLEGSLYIKGKVRISSIFFPVIWYLLTKPVRTVVIDYVKGDRK